LSFLRHKKIYQSDGLKRELNCSFSSLTDHRSDESSTGYSFMSCSPAELMSASPVLQSFSLNLAAVKLSAANRNCPSFSLSQPRGPLQAVPHSPPILPPLHCIPFRKFGSLRWHVSGAE
jgi:hypothetical protein